MAFAAPVPTHPNLNAGHRHTVRHWQVKAGPAKQNEGCDCGPQAPTGLQSEPLDHDMGEIGPQGCPGGRVADRLLAALPKAGSLAA